MQKLALVFLFYHQLFVCLLPVGEGAGSGDGFLYFDGPDDLFTNYDSVITEQEWMGDLLANFQRVPDKRERDRPKTLLCHDFKGGYQPYESVKGSRAPIPDGPEAKQCAGSPNNSTTFQHTPPGPEKGPAEAIGLTKELICEMPANNRSGRVHSAKKQVDCATMPTNRIVQPYVFTHWWYIDTFVYFSHKFLTIPPKVWIDQAHQHGVLALGLFITEAGEGQTICKRLLGNRTELDRIIESMTDLAVRYNFDGWLINIENEIQKDHIPALQYFLDSLRKNLCQRFPYHKRTQVIWYESVLDDGEWSNENELNNRNSIWLNHVDGFFLNYFWQPGNLTRTVKQMRANFTGRSLTDIYVGVDVWGRNATGRWQTVKAMEAIRRLGLSAAIFAPGWLTEAFPNRDCLHENSAHFWSSLQPFVTSHALRARSFRTHFHTGISHVSHGETRGKVENQRKIGEKELKSPAKELLYRLGNGQLQPHYLGLAESTAHHDNHHGLELRGGGPKYEHILFECDIPVDPASDSQVVVRISSLIPFGLRLVFSANDTSSIAGTSRIVEQNIRGASITMNRVRIPQDAKSVAKIALFELDSSLREILLFREGLTPLSPRIYTLDFWIE